MLISGFSKAIVHYTKRELMYVCIVYVQNYTNGEVGSCRYA